MGTIADAQLYTETNTIRGSRERLTNRAPAIEVVHGLANGKSG